MKELLNDPKIQLLIMELGLAIAVLIIGKFDKRNIVTKILKKLADKLESK